MLLITSPRKVLSSNADNMVRQKLPYVFITIILQCSFSSYCCSASRILGLFPVMSKSHFAIHNSLMKALASRGHRVVVISPFGEIDVKTSSNYTHLRLGQTKSVPSFVDSIMPDEAQRLSGFRSFFEAIMLSGLEPDGCVNLYTHDYVRQLVSDSHHLEPPELIIAEIAHLPCYSPLAEKFDIPVIASLPPVDTHGVDYLIGNPLQPAYIPTVVNGYTQRMTFWQRLINWLQYAITYVAHYGCYVNQILKIDEDYVGNDGVTLEKLSRRVSLVFFDNHFSFLNRPTVPNAIEIGGIHIHDAKLLPSEIQKFIDEAEAGVIFFSYGSAIKMSGMTKEKIEMFMKAFSRIPQRILWRSDVVNMTDGELPPNIMIKKWFPQRDILEHQNVKAFISHGGLLSTYEAIHTGTPVIGIPFIWDQYTNVNILQEKGVAIALNYETLSYGTLLKALNDIIDNRQYHDNMQKLSTIFKDRPMTPLDTAVYWTEYVIRHKGAPHLRVASADMPFYKFLLLDVIGFILIFTLLFIWMISYLFKKLVISRIPSTLSSKKKVQ